MKAALIVTVSSGLLCVALAFGKEGLRVQKPAPISFYQVPFT